MWISRFSRFVRKYPWKRNIERLCRDSDGKTFTFTPCSCNIYCSSVITVFWFAGRWRQTDNDTTITVIQISPLTPFSFAPPLPLAKSISLQLLLAPPPPCHRPPYIYSNTHTHTPATAAPRRRSNWSRLSRCPVTYGSEPWQRKTKEGDPGRSWPHHRLTSWDRQPHRHTHTHTHSVPTIFQTVKFNLKHEVKMQHGALDQLNPAAYWPSGVLPGRHIGVKDKQNP